MRAANEPHRRPGVRPWGSHLEWWRLPRTTFPDTTASELLPSSVRSGLVAFLASQMFIGQMLLSAEGDTLLLLQSLSGAVGMTAFTYVLPFAFSWILHGKDFGRLTKGWYAFNIGVGLVIMGTGVVTSVAGLVGTSHGVFNGDCRIRYDVSSSEGAPMRSPGRRRDSRSLWRRGPHTRDEVLLLWRRKVAAVPSQPQPQPAPASGQPQPGAPRPPEPQLQSQPRPEP